MLDWSWARINEELHAARAHRAEERREHYRVMLHLLFISQLPGEDGIRARREAYENLATLGEEEERGDDLPAVSTPSGGVWPPLGMVVHRVPAPVGPNGQERATGQ